MAARQPLITLLTDFGLDDTYVGQMKGVIAGICPGAMVIDLAHAVRPQQVEQGAFLLETAIGAFPAGSIHLAVVDPGVGTERAALVIQAQDRYLVGPDNGLLSCALPTECRPPSPARVVLPDRMRAVRLPIPRDRPVSATFHGRDVFAVAAAHLAAGASLDSLGERAGDMFALPPFAGNRRSPDLITGRVVHIDRFGNLITTVLAEQLHSRPRAVTIAGKRVDTIVTTYAEGAGLVALTGSSGYLEVAEVNGNAAARLGASIGDAVAVEC